MKPEDTIESHKERCVEEMTETHQFETMELANVRFQKKFSIYAILTSGLGHIRNTQNNIYLKKNVTKLFIKVEVVVNCLITQLKFWEIAKTFKKKTSGAAPGISAI